MRPLLFILIFFVHTALFPQGEKDDYTPVKDAGNVVNELKTASTKINTIKSDFVQEKHLAFLNDIIISKGKFWFKKENQLRWEYMTPFEYVIVSDGEKFIIKDENNIKEYDIRSNKVFQEINNLIISSVRGTLLEKADFTFSVFENDDSYLVKMIPAKEEMFKVLKRIELYFNKSDKNINSVKMVENEDDYTVISFVNKKINEAIPSDIFSVD
jgi:outer membrane lipoprotein-sorting protein